MSGTPIIFIIGGVLLALVAFALFVITGRQPPDGEEHLGRGLLEISAFGVAFFLGAALITIGMFFVITQ